MEHPNEVKLVLCSAQNLENLKESYWVQSMEHQSLAKLVLGLGWNWAQL